VGLRADIDAREISQLSCPCRELNLDSAVVQPQSLISLPTEIFWLHTQHIYTVYSMNFGRAIAQAVSRRLPTAAARVRAQVRLCGICGGQLGTGAGFLRGFRFSLPILIPPTAPHSSSSTIRGCHNRPESGRRASVSPHRKKQKKN
jgi:hypothetical protein